jgi:hypothetical protein
MIDSERTRDYTSSLMDLVHDATDSDGHAATELLLVCVMTTIVQSSRTREDVVLRTRDIAANIERSALNVYDSLKHGGPMQ